MKKIAKKVLGVGVLMAMSLTNYNCGVEEIIDELDGNCDESWAVQVKPELDGLNSAASVFQNDPNQSNCENFVNAVKLYVEAMEEVENCVLGSQTKSYSEALEAAKAELSSSDCSNL